MLNTVQLSLYYFFYFYLTISAAASSQVIVIHISLEGPAASTHHSARVKGWSNTRIQDSSIPPSHVSLGHNVLSGLPPTDWHISNQHILLTVTDKPWLRVCFTCEAGSRNISIWVLIIISLFDKERLSFYCVIWGHRVSLGPRVGNKCSNISIYQHQTPAHKNLDEIKRGWITERNNESWLRAPRSAPRVSLPARVWLTVMPCNYIQTQIFIA